MKRWLFGALALLFVLHNDFWQWHDPRLALGLPIGLTYHLIWVVAVSVVMFLLVTKAWPSHLETDSSQPDDDSGQQSSDS